MAGNETHSESGSEVAEAPWQDVGVLEAIAAVIHLDAVRSGHPTSITYRDQQALIDAFDSTDNEVHNLAMQSVMHGLKMGLQSASRRYLWMKRRKEASK
jgi:hypothetical protein